MKHNNKNKNKNNKNISHKNNIHNNNNNNYSKTKNYILSGCLNHPGCAWSCMCDCKNCQLFEEKLFENITK